MWIKSIVFKVNVNNSATHISNKM